MVPHGHAPRKRKLPVVAKACLLLNNGGNFSLFLYQENKSSKEECSRKEIAYQEPNVLVNATCLELLNVSLFF